MKLAAVLVVLAIGVCVEGKGWWMEQPYDNDDFNYRVEYGDAVNVTCDNDPRLDGLVSYTVDYWVIPDMTLMYANNYLDFKTLDGQAGWEVSNDAESIRLFIITEYHFGFYYCLVSGNNTEGDFTQLMVKKAVNYKGPFFDDLWDDYRMNTIVAFSSSIIFLLLAGSIYGFNLWWERKHGSNSVDPIEEEDDIDQKKEEMEEGQSYSNGAYAAEMQEKVVEQQPEASSKEEDITNV